MSMDNDENGLNPKRVMRDMDFKKRVGHSEQKSNPPESTAKKSMWSRVPLTKVRLITGAVVLLVLLSGFLTYKYVEISHQIKQLRNNPQQVVSTSTQKLLTKVGALALLPQGQNPTVAIVKNVSQLKNQAFFASAQDGDYLIIYAQAKKAVLYRPSDNRIVEYANTD